MSGPYRHIPLQPTRHRRPRTRRVGRVVAACLNPAMWALWGGLLVLACGTLGPLGFFLWVAAVAGYADQRRRVRRLPPVDDPQLPYDNV